MRDVGKSKAEVAAERVMQRVHGVEVTPHFCRIEDKPPEWYQDFHIIILGLDSLEVRSALSPKASSSVNTPKGASPKHAETSNPEVLPLIN